MVAFSKIVISDSSAVIAVACTICALLLLHRLLVKLGAYARNEAPLSPGVLPTSQLKYGQANSMRVMKTEKRNKIEMSPLSFEDAKPQNQNQKQDQQQDVKGPSSVRRTPVSSKRFDTTEALDKMFNRVDEIASQFNNLQNTLDNVNSVIKSPASSILGYPLLSSASPSVRPPVSPFAYALPKVAEIEEADTDTEDEETVETFETPEETPIIFNKTRSAGSVRFLDEALLTESEEPAPEPPKPRRRSFVDSSLLSRQQEEEVRPALAERSQDQENIPVEVVKTVAKKPIAVSSRPVTGRKSMGPLIGKMVKSKENEGSVSKMLSNLRSVASKEDTKPQRKSLVPSSGLVAPKRTVGVAATSAPRKSK
eukprot:TRINITY_DN1557_c0_g1_i1.p1 TRINITY_DN1557_c0_g1~~TRINITY_DN1557_c0_g1_i1.p1  ORF type:complete len:423 (+),score=217.96 TRINITY_DN1557_c0_g1_i1:171-1271(+)